MPTTAVVPYPRPERARERHRDERRGKRGRQRAGEDERHAEAHEAGRTEALDEEVGGQGEEGAGQAEGGAEYPGGGEAEGAHQLREQGRVHPPTEVQEKRHEEKPAERAGVGRHARGGARRGTPTGVVHGLCRSLACHPRPVRMIDSTPWKRRGSSAPGEPVSCAWSPSAGRRENGCERTRSGCAL